MGKEDIGSHSAYNYFVRVQTNVQEMLFCKLLHKTVFLTIVGVKLEFLG